MVAKNSQVALSRIHRTEPFKQILSDLFEDLEAHSLADNGGTRQRNECAGRTTRNTGFQACAGNLLNFL